jgi:hypothetical protein
MDEEVEVLVDLLTDVLGKIIMSQKHKFLLTVLSVRMRKV